MSEEENGGVIDGRYSIGPEDVGDFVRVEVGVCMCVCVCVHTLSICMCAHFVHLYVCILPSSLPQAPLGYGDGGLSTTQELETCKRTVLSPYMYFLKLVSELQEHDSIRSWY